MKRVLIVDDDAANRDLLEFAFKQAGWEVGVAADGAEALERARAEPPDLIVTDILMPRMDGFVLCREWRADEKLKRIPFVFYTATCTEPQDEDFALSLGADRFVRKPENPGRLLEIAAEVIARKAAGREAVASPAAESDAVVLRQYNEVLVHKLEKKMLDLELAQQRLQAESGERAKTQAALAEAERLNRATLDALPGNLCVIDQRGTILLVNDAWNRFAHANGVAPQAVGVGCNYLDVCRNASGPSSDEAKPFAAQLDAVIGGEQTDFEMEYPCHSPDRKRWFTARVRRFPGDGPVRAVILHTDNTSGKLAQAQIEDQLEQLRSWHAATLEREDRVLELKHEVNELLRRLEQPPRYPSTGE